MINLTVTTFNDRPVANLSASFDELGGTIGRSKTNQLVLPDPDRVVSRVHAKIVFRGGSYCLVACGANALMHNQTVVNPGSEVGLSVGDSIRIEGYCIAVTSPETRDVSDPFAALFELEPATRPPSVSAPPGVPTARPSKPMAASPAAPSVRGKAGIPEDWDPFEHKAQDSTPLGRAQPMQRAFLERDLPAAPPADSIDSLFGLQEQSPDQLARALGVPDAQPNTGGHSDPLRSLDAPPKAAAMPVSDHVADLNAPWVNRKANAASANTTPIPKGAVLSWNAGVHEAGIAGKPEHQSVLDQGAPAPERKPMMEPRVPGSGDTARAQARPEPARQALAEAQVDELLEGLNEGLATPGLQIERLTPELMTQLGQLLREATKGTVELLAIRAALKREIRADVTIINASENNPLKFSPDVDGAMQHMLGQKMRGFMGPVDSMRDAFQDLRAHELGVMAGMKAALAGVLLRFDPHVLEDKLTGSSSISDLIPSPRKARLWNQFEALYKQLAGEAEADFDALFGKAFLKAYESYIGQLEVPPKNE